jgi:hypothetical protein
MTRFKLVSLFLAVALFTTTTADAQWIGTAPGPIYYNGGKVGIGASTTPQYELDVTGSIGVAGADSFVRTSGNSDTTFLTFLGTRLRIGQINSRAYGYTGNAVAYIGGFSNGVELLRINSNTGNGNLVVTQSGVDSLQLNATNTNIRHVHTDPASAVNMIDFAEGTTAYGFLNQRGSTNEAGKFNLGNNVGAVGIYSAGSERIHVATNGNVGVGYGSSVMNTSTYKLDVNGALRVNGGIAGGSLTSSAGTSQIGTDVSSVNPILYLRVGATGYYPMVLFQTETAQEIGSVTGYKNGGLIMKSGLAQQLFFRTNGDTANAMTINAAGNVGIGLAPGSNYRFEVAGNAHFSGTVTGGNIAAKYQDVAEWVPSATNMTAGTVVVLDPSVSNHVMPSSRPYDTSVAGVVSAQPGLILGEESASSEMIATTGRVKVRVDATRGPIRIGDLLVTGAKPGMAMKSEMIDVAGVQIHRPGTIVGKALEALDGGEGEILVLLSLQ